MSKQPKPFPLIAGFTVLGNLGRKQQPRIEEVEAIQPTTRITQELKITPDMKQGGLLAGLKQALSSIQLPQFGTRAAQTKPEEQPELVTENTESKPAAKTRVSPLTALSNLAGSLLPRRVTKRENITQEEEQAWHPTQTPTYQNFVTALGKLQQRQSQPLDIGQYLMAFRDSNYEELSELHKLVQHLSGHSWDSVTEQDYNHINDLFEAYESEWMSNIATYNQPTQPATAEPKKPWNPLASLQALKLPQLNLNAKSWFAKQEKKTPQTNPADPAPIAKASLLAGVAGIWASVSNTITTPRKPKALETPKLSIAEYIEQLGLSQGSRIHVEYLTPADTGATTSTTTALEVIQIKDDSTVMARDAQGMVVHIEPINILGKGADDEALGTLPSSDISWISNPDLVTNKPRSLREKSILLQLQAIDFLKRYKWAIGGGVAAAAVIAYLIAQDHTVSNNIASAVNTNPVTQVNPVGQIPDFGLNNIPEIKIPSFSIPSLPTLPEQLSRLNPSDILTIHTPVAPIAPSGIEQSIANNLSNLGAQVVEVGQRIWHDAGVSHTGFHMDISSSNIKLHLDPALLNHMKSTLGSTDTAQILINFADGTNQVVSIPVTGGDVILDSTTQAYKAIASNTASHFEFGKLVNGAWNIFSSFKR